MSSNYGAWVRQMHEQRDAEHAEQERRQMALRAMVERDQAAAIAMRQRNYEGEAAAARRNQTDEQYAAQRVNADAGYAAQRVQTENGYAVRRKRMYDERRYAAYHGNVASLRSVQDGYVAQRRGEFISGQRAAIRRGSMNRPAMAMIGAVAVGGGSRGYRTQMGVAR